MFRRLSLALCAAALLLPAAAAAEDGDGIEDIAAELAYHHCPDYLDGSLTLDGNGELRALGFTGKPQRSANARFGELQFLTLKRPDGEISFGGVPGQVCQVNTFGPKLAAVRTQLRAGITMLARDFEPDPGNSGKQPNGATVETVMSKLDSTTVLRVQFIDAVVQGMPMTSFQIFMMDQ